MANLVNYFGKSESVDDVTIYPILFEKGITRFALYGLGYIRDERLHATFQERKVKFFRPLEDKNDWFSLFAIHQNRFFSFCLYPFVFYCSQNQKTESLTTKKATLMNQCWTIFLILFYGAMNTNV